MVGGLLSALALLTLASIAWSSSAERAFVEFNRTALYVGIFVVAVLAGTRGNVGRWVDGIAAGLTAVGVLSLASRLFPDTLPAGQVPEFLPSAFSRLSWPVEYWNGLAILVALAFPLLLRVASTGHAVWRALAVAAFPPLVATMYLTSSRGGFATAIVGLVAFLVMTPRRWAAGGALFLGGAGSVAAIAVLTTRDELVNNPSDSPLATSQGRSAALLILAIAAAVALLHWLGSRFLAPRLHPPRVLGWVAVGAVVVAAVAGIAAADPVERIEAFQDPPTAFEGESDFVQAHLLSGNGSGRWQFWAAAIDQWESEPAAGRGAGSYEAWWAENGSIDAFFIRDAHSLYLEALGELGVIGFVLLVAAFGAGAIVGIRRVLVAEGEERLVIAALLACFFGYAVAAGIDWMWELTVVSAVGTVVLGLLTGPATAAGQRPWAATAETPRTAGRRDASQPAWQPSSSAGSSSVRRPSRSWPTSRSRTARRPRGGATSSRRSTTPFPHVSSSRGLPRPTSSSRSCRKRQGSMRGRTRRFGRLSTATRRTGDSGSSRPVSRPTPAMSQRHGGASTGQQNSIHAPRYLQVSSKEPAGPSSRVGYVHYPRLPIVLSRDLPC